MSGIVVDAVEAVLSSVSLPGLILQKILDYAEKDAIFNHFGIYSLKLQILKLRNMKHSVEFIT